MQDTTWASQAACATQEPDLLFVRGAAQRPARELCFSCRVRTECLADALDSRTEFGVWGGLTERERRLLLRRFPDVDSWSRRLQQDDDELVADLTARRPPHFTAARKAPVPSAAASR
ncbi:WhiB family transcriptional regulator [Georgenia sp. SYP-B2076]|uniref:WhiB family transcriptional regulator n=1 Tax=Georgenia sp. SYP-B2076 TaxID=2495881 RepID=UPI003511F68A